MVTIIKMIVIFKIDYKKKFLAIDRVLLWKNKVSLNNNIMLGKYDKRYT
jgi:hypothetical protein